jgi:hypothetical protein
VAEADPYRIRPSAYWYGLVAVAWLLAAVCMFFAMKPFFDVLDVTPVPTDNRALVDVSGEGLTVYATASISGGSLCTLSDGRGRVVSLEGVTDAGTFEVTTADGTQMYPIATTPKGLAAGEYTLRCAGVGGLLLGLGDRVDYDAVLLQVGGMFILAGVFGLGGLALLIVLLVKRHSSKERARWAHAAYAGWGQWYSTGYPAYQGYPQQEYQGYPGYAGYSGYPGYAQSGYPQQSPGPSADPQQSPPPDQPADEDPPAPSGGDAR